MANVLKELEGHEILSIQFEGCVMVKDGKIITRNGTIKPNAKQVKELWNEYIYQEYGTTDLKTMLKMEGF